MQLSSGTRRGVFEGIEILAASLPEHRRACRARRNDPRDDGLRRSPGAGPCCCPCPAPLPCPPVAPRPSIAVSVCVLSVLEPMRGGREGALRPRLARSNPLPVQRERGLVAGARQAKPKPPRNPHRERRRERGEHARTHARGARKLACDEPLRGGAAAARPPVSALCRTRALGQTTHARTDGQGGAGTDTSFCLHVCLFVRRSVPS
jgi:hypothetical protein